MTRSWISIVIIGFVSMTTLIHSEEAEVKQTLSLNISELDLITEKALKLFDVPGASVGVIVDNQILFSKGYGSRNLELELPVTENTVFPIASCTKPFTALLMGTLVQEGKLHWDDPVKKYIPEFNLLDSEMADSITIRDLIAHRTGIPRHDSIWIFRHILRKDILEIFHHLDSEYGLRKEFQYNNFMYSIAGMVIERITGQTWENAIEERIFKPLCMNESSTSIDAMKSGSNFSLAYFEHQDVIHEIPHCNTHPVSPGGGINASLSDMLKWVQLQLSQGSVNGTLLCDLKEMHSIQMPFPSQPHSVASPLNVDSEVVMEGYGLGWFIGTYREEDLISHGGCIHGFHSDVSFLPNKGIGIVVLTNSSSDGRSVIDLIKNHLFDQLLNAPSIDRFAPFSNHRKMIKDAIRTSVQNFTELTKDKIIRSELNSYAGTYSHPGHGSVSIQVEDNHLTASYGNLFIPLYFKEENQFIGNTITLAVFGIDPIATFSFVRNETGEVTALHIPFEGFRGAKPIRFEKF